MKAKEQLILRQIMDENILVPVNEAAQTFRGLMSMNETGALLWKLLQKGTSEDEMVQSLIEEYEVDEISARSDVQKYIEVLKQWNLLVADQE